MTAGAQLRIRSMGPTGGLQSYSHDPILAPIVTPVRIHPLGRLIRDMNLRMIELLPAACSLLILGCGSTANPDVPRDRNDRSAMQTIRIDVKGHPFEVWVARTREEQELGLMRVTEDQLATLPGGVERGMLFIFSSEQMLAFWMLNTIIPLDIIYIRGDGQIVKKYTMAPQETRLYPSIEPAIYALEMRAGLLEQLNIGPGDHVEIPQGVLKGTP